MNNRRRVVARGTTPVTDPCTLLQQAQAALGALLSGQAAAEIETPQLGRVRFAPTTVADLQRYVDQLTIQCNQQNGVANTGGRVPFSFQAWP
jgi:hypothetical protein